MAVNFVKLCTAAFAGSLIGVAYERLPPVSEWPNIIPSVAADSRIVRRDANPNDAPLDVPLLDKQLIDPKKSAENLKDSAKFGLPSKDNIRLFNDFILSYDRRLRSPAWVIEHLTPEKLRDKKLTSRSRSNFMEDPAIHEYFRAKKADFHNSGYDRGHMAAAGNHKDSQEDLDQTFYLSNISPQAPQLNRGCWERLERYVRWRTNRAKNVYVVTGPLYLPMEARDGNLYVTYRVLGSNHVSVPTHYFKVFLVETKDDKLELEAFLMPNTKELSDDVRLDDFRVPLERLDIIERSSGVILFDQVNRSKMIGRGRLHQDFKDAPRDYPDRRTLPS